MYDIKDGAVMAPEVLSYLVQPTATSCIPTCLAMALGSSVATIQSMLDNPCFSTKTHDVFEQLGIVYKRGIVSDGIMLGRLNFLIVPSLNLPAESHYLLYDARHGVNQLYDPNRLRPNKKYYTFDEPSEPNEYKIRWYGVDYGIKVSTDH